MTPSKGEAQSAGDAIPQGRSQGPKDGADIEGGVSGKISVGEPNATAPL